MRVELIIDGRTIPLNRYVQSVFGNVIAALISTLKGVDENWKSVEVKIQR